MGCASSNPGGHDDNPQGEGGEALQPRSAFRESGVLLRAASSKSRDERERLAAADADKAGGGGDGGMADAGEGDGDGGGVGTGEGDRSLQQQLREAKRELKSLQEKLGATQEKLRERDADCERELAATQEAWEEVDKLRAQADSFELQQREAVEGATAAGARAVEGSHALIEDLQREIEVLEQRPNGSSAARAPPPTAGREETAMMALGELEDERGQLASELAASRALLQRRDGEAERELAAVRSALGDAHDQLMSLEQQSDAIHERYQRELQQLNAELESYRRQRPGRR